MKNNNARKKKLLALLLSGMMTASLAVGFSACSDDSSSSSSSSSSSTADSTQKDDGMIKNADFQIFNTNNGLNVIGTSVSGWTRKVNSPTSGSALSSKSASGIVDTAKWDELFSFSDGYDDETIKDWTEDTAKNNWENMSVKDKLTYYKHWEDKNDDDDKQLKDLSFYENFNIGHEDVPTCENPKTHDDDKEDTNVLMLHNHYYSANYENFGTAQKYESSTTVTVKAGTSAEFSVWVKTMDLTSTTTGGDVQEAIDKGAYISITNSLGSSSLDPLMIKNINTAGVDTNNGWVQYKFYLQSSTYADATFKIVLGLGLGGGTDRSEYVNGYAFFDDISCKTISNDDYDLAVKDNSIDAKVVTHSTEKDQKIVNAASEEFDLYAIDFAPAATKNPWTVLDSAWDVDPTTERGTNGTLYTAADNHSDANVQTYQGLGITTANDKAQIYTVSDMATANNTYLQAVYNQAFKDSTIVSASDKVLMLLSSNGAAYTAQSDALKLTLQPGEYKAVSFLVKTSALNGFTGANATLLDGTSKTVISSIDTTTIDKVDIDDETKDIYEGWQRCYFFLSNETTEAQTATLSLGFGPTTVIGQDKSAFYAGFAAFTDFTVYDFSGDKDAFDLAAEDEYTKVVALEGVDESTSGDSGFDTPAYIPTDAIETGFANPQNYKGVYSDSAYVVSGGTNADVNTNANAGLLNKEHADNYTAILEKLGGAGATWDTAIGDDATQPLVIYNEGAQTKSYGFIGKLSTMSANSYQLVSLRLKVSQGATASVYLVDTSKDTREDMLTIGTKTVYWYDEDGNICVKDPSKNNFNKTRDIAFKKVQANGLYKVNPSWSGASEVDADKYYANLSAYEMDEETGNLLVAENGVSYNYTNKWLNDGNDGIAFYAEQNGENYRYYANSQKQEKDEVLDLASVTALQPRYTANDDKSLFVTVTGDAATPEWKTVLFYVHTGADAKDYRLEVWSGTRDNTVVNSAGSYVIVDSYNPGNADSKFSSLVDLRKEQIDDNNALGSYFESVYSFYDTDAFLRYDESADENNVGDSYEDYRSSAYTEGVAYLEYDNGKTYEFYVDYSLVDQTVNPDVEEDDTQDEEDETTPIDPASVWLLVGSILIAVVLLGAVVSVIVRKTIGKRIRLTKPVKKNKNNK